VQVDFLSLQSDFEFTCFFHLQLGWLFDLRLANCFFVACVHSWTRCHKSFSLSWTSTCASCLQIHSLHSWLGCILIIENDLGLTVNLCLVCAWGVRSIVQTFFICTHTHWLSCRQMGRVTALTFFLRLASYKRAVTSLTLFILVLRGFVLLLKTGRSTFVYCWKVCSSNLIWRWGMIRCYTSGQVIDCNYLLRSYLSRGRCFICDYWVILADWVWKTSLLLL
jgi:hypothetical protein